MKHAYPKVLAICLAIAVYCNNKSVKSLNQDTSDNQEYQLFVIRGAYHCDGFELSKNRIRYLPDTLRSALKKKFNSYEETYLDTMATIGFFKKIEARGFWELSPHYESKRPCPSKLVVTLKNKKRTKTVICEDYENDCPELLKYIDKKVVEMQGRQLHRIYVPG